MSTMDNKITEVTLSSFTRGDSTIPFTQAMAMELACSQAELQLGLWWDKAMWVTDAEGNQSFTDEAQDEFNEYYDYNLDMIYEMLGLSYDEYGE